MAKMSTRKRTRTKSSASGSMVKRKKYGKSAPSYRRLKGIPDYTYQQFNYATTVQMTNVSGDNKNGYYEFRLNSIYDPDFTGIGHQPLLHDQMQVLFNHYHVYASRITITPIIGEANWHLGILPAAEAYSIAGKTTNELAEQPNIKTYLYGNNASICPLSHYITIRKLDGEMPDDAIYTSSFGANPTEKRNWKITGSRENGVDFDAMPYINVKITYYTKCSKRRILDQS